MVWPGCKVLWFWCVFKQESEHKKNVLKAYKRSVFAVNGMKIDCIEYEEEFSMLFEYKVIEYSWNNQALTPFFGIMKLTFLFIYWAF